jgi:hypothetical protein
MKAAAAPAVGTAKVADSKEAAPQPFGAPSTASAASASAASTASAGAGNKVNFSGGYGNNTTAAGGDGKWGVGEHTDYGVLTILAQDDIGGM